jgi:hypothetical protein
MGEKGNVSEIVGVAGEGSLASDALDAVSGMAKDTATGVASGEVSGQIENARKKRADKKDPTGDESG